MGGAKAPQRLDGTATIAITGCLPQTLWVVPRLHGWTCPSTCFHTHHLGWSRIGSLGSTRAVPSCPSWNLPESMRETRQALPPSRDAFLGCQSCDGTEPCLDRRALLLRFVAAFTFAFPELHPLEGLPCSCSRTFQPIAPLSPLPMRRHLLTCPG